MSTFTGNGRPVGEVSGRIDPRTKLGAVHLTVADLNAQVDFYTGALGFQVHRRNDGFSALGAGGDDLLLLTERRGARRATRTAGLYHFCVLVPRRVELAHLLQRIAETGTHTQGLVDHRSAEAIYLADPEGNGIELNWDRPREQWPDMRLLLRLGNAPLDVDGLMGELKAAPGVWQGLPSDASIGHIHLHVGDLTASRRFYIDVLGFDEMMEFPGQAVFVSAGGYHHHIAFNIWAGLGAAPPPESATGLRYFTVRLPSSEALAAVVERVRAAGLELEEQDGGVLLRDPSRNGVLLSTAWAG